MAAVDAPRTVRCVFQVKGDADAAAPVALVADIDTLTVGCLRAHATSTVAHHPFGCVSVAVEGKVLRGNDSDLVSVPDACVIRPPRPQRAPRESKSKPADAAADAEAKPATEEAPAADAAAAEKPATADAEAEAPAPVVEDEDKDDAKEASADDKKDDAAAAGSPKKKKPSKKGYQPREPPQPARDLVVTVSVVPLRQASLGTSRNPLVKPGGRANLCAACNSCKLRSDLKEGADAPVLLDCGHAVCPSCLKAHQEKVAAEKVAERAAAEKAFEDAKAKAQTDFEEAMKAYEAKKAEIEAEAAAAAEKAKAEAEAAAKAKAEAEAAAAAEAEAKAKADAEAAAAAAEGEKKEEGAAAAAAEAPAADAAAAKDAAAAPKKKADKKKADKKAAKEAAPKPAKAEAPAAPKLPPAPKLQKVPAPIFPKAPKYPHVECPCCGFWTLTTCALPAEGEPRAAGASYLKPADEFFRPAADAIAASTRASTCSVCNAAEAVGRCSTELITMCEKCFDEHLPTGPLRASHTLQRFEGANSAAEVLCANSSHRNLPVNYFCVDHGKLGCHMCLKDTTEHDKCQVASQPDELAAIANDLRAKREAETTRVVNQTISGTRTAWDAHAELRSAYEKLQRDIDAKAEAFKAAVEQQRVAALAHLQACYDDSLGRWESRLNALDAVRARAAFVGAVLDGHRNLPDSLLLHADAAGTLSLAPEGDKSLKSAVATLAQPQNIANLTVNFRAEVPPLFDVNNSHPSVAGDAPAAGGKKPAVAKNVATRSDAVMATQTTLGAVAKKWRDDAAAAAKKAAQAADASSAAPAPKGAKKLVPPVEKMKAVSTATVPALHAKPSSPTAAAGESPAAASPTKPTPFAEFTSIARGPKDTMLLVDAERNAVYVAKLGGKASQHQQAKITHVLGGGAESMMFKGASETVTVAANNQVALKAPAHAFYHAKAKTIVVCDAGNDRLVLYPEALDAKAVPTFSSDKVVKSPMAACYDPASSGIMVFEKTKITVVSADASTAITSIKYPGLLQKGLRAPYMMTATSHATRGLVVMIRANGDVSVVAANGGDHLGDIVNGALVDPATAKEMRKNEDASAAAAANHKSFVAVASHPETNTAVLASAPKKGEWAVTLTVIGLEEETRMAEQPPVSARHQPGGRKIQQAPQQVVVPVLKVLKTVTLPLASVPRSEPGTSFAIAGMEFDRADRLAIGVRELSTERTTLEDGSIRIRRVVAPVRFALLQP